MVVYSFSPALVKILGNQVFFLINVPIVLLLILKNTYTFKELSYVIVFISGLVAQLLYIHTTYLDINTLAYYQSVYISIFPMLGIFVAKKYELTTIIRVIFIVASFHAIFALLTNDYISYPSFIQSNIDIIKEGSAYLRLSSVAGSLIFGVIVATGFNSYLYLCAIGRTKANHEHILGGLLLISAFLSLQRSAWLAIVIGLFLYAIQNAKKFLIALLFGGAMIFLIGFIISTNEFYLERFQTLFSSDNDAIDERMLLWITAYEYASEHYIGGGFGQAGIIGHSNSVSFPAIITDGDYLKLLVEGGALFLFFYLGVFAISFKKIFSAGIEAQKLSLCAILLGFMVQMIGSNISEFYFANYLLWLFVGGIYYSDDFKSFHKKNN